MKRKIIIAGCLIAFAYLQLETATLISKLWPEFAGKEIDPFWSKEYHFVGANKMVMAWWIKFCCNDLKNIIVMLTMAWVAVDFSKKLSGIFLCYGLYHITDNLMLWYNYRTSQWVYWLENGCIILSIVLLFVVKERRGAKIKSII